MESKFIAPLKSLLIPFFIGAIAFFLFLGPAALAPGNLGWLWQGDSWQHYLGWGLYRHGPWGLPLGLNPSYGLDISSSIVFSDSIPFLALVFKALSPALPQHFQYFGLWTLICFVLQAYLALKLMQLINTDKASNVLAAALFMLSPPLLFRIGMHSALLGHFLILWALYLNLSSKARKSYVALWAFLLCITACVHFYIFIIVFGLYIASLLDRLLINHKINLSGMSLELVVIIPLLYLSLWQAGYFAIDFESANGDGFGTFQTNLLGIFDSQGWSYILAPFRVNHPTLEDFNYLGLGIIFCLAFSFAGFYKNRKSFFLGVKKHIFLFCCLFLFLLLSVSNNLLIGTSTFSFPLPESLIAILSVIRASGRLFWPIFYSILFVTFFFLFRTYKYKSIRFILLVAIILQIIDMAPGWLPIRDRITKATNFGMPTTTLKNPFWSAAGNHYHKIISIPFEKSMLQNQWPFLAELAYLGLGSTNSVYLARVDGIKIDAANIKFDDKLKSGKLDSDSLYIIDKWEQFPTNLIFDPKQDLLARIDGIYVLAPGWKNCVNCPPIDSALELNRLMPVTFVNTPISFAGSSSERKLFLSKTGGWSSPETWGVWSVGREAKLMLPLPSANIKTLTLNMRALVGPTHPEQRIEVDINGKGSSLFILSKLEGNSISMRIPPELSHLPYISVRLQFLNPVKPKNLGYVNDDRQISIGLTSIEFN